MIRNPFVWELPENQHYFVHTRNNGDNYYDPKSWDIAFDTPKALIEEFEKTMKEMQEIIAKGFDD